MFVVVIVVLSPGDDGDGDGCVDERLRLTEFLFPGVSDQAREAAET